MEIGKRPLYDGFCLEYRKFTRGASVFHSHVGIEFNFCEEGDGSISIGTDRWKIRSGGINVIYGPRPHGVAANYSQEYLRTVINVPESIVKRSFQSMRTPTPEWMPTFSKPITQLTPKPGDYSELERLLGKLHKEMEERKHTGRLGSDSLTYFSEVLRIFDRGDSTISGPVEDISLHDRLLIEQALKIIRKSAPFIPFPKELSDRLGVSEGHLRRIFRHVLGRSPSEVTFRRRIELAKEQLLKGDALDKVARQSRYSNTSSFSRAFKRDTGLSPLQFVRFHRWYLREKSGKYIFDRK